MWNWFRGMAEDGLIDLSMLGALIACALASPPAAREAFIYAAIACAIMTASHLALRFGVMRRPGERAK